MDEVLTLEALEQEVRTAGLRVHIAREGAQMRAVRTSSPLEAHKEYLRRWLSFIARFASRPADAQLVALPTNAIFYQFATVYGQRHLLRTPDLRRAAERGASSAQPRLLMATGDYGQRVRSRWESTAPGRAYPRLWEWLDERFTLIAFESTADLGPRDVAMLPYPLLGGDGGASTQPRDLLYSFAGAVAYPQLPAEHIRGGRLRSIVGSGADWFVGTADEARATFGDAAGSDIAMLQRSTFTLCPAGFGRWTFRLGQALHYGSIPVVLADGYQFPHSRSIDWDRCAVVVAERDVDTVPDVLRSLPSSEVRERQDALRRHAHLFDERGVHLMAARQLCMGLGLLKP